MPLARILTRFSEDEDTSWIVDRLRTAGYTVETSAPDDLPREYADLEITLEKYPRPEAIIRAAELAGEVAADGNVNVYLAAGVVPARSNAAEKLPSLTPVVDFEAERREQEHLELRRKAEEAERLRMERAQAEAQARAKAKIKAETEAARQRQQEQEELRRNAEATRLRVARAKAEALAQANAEAERRRNAEAERQRNQEAERQRSEEAERNRQEAERLRSAAAASIAQEQERAASLPAAEAKPATLPAALSQPQPAAALPQPMASIPRPHRSIERARTTPVELKRSGSHRDRQLRTAGAIAAVVSVGVMLGWGAYASRRPASPLSPGVLMQSPKIVQQVPFGPASVAPQPRPPAMVHRTNTARQQPRTTKPSAARSSTPAATKSKKKRPRYASGGNSVAEDEVIIRHFGTPPAPSPPTEAKAGIRRYSDMR